MKQDELNEILRLHEAWLAGEDGGERAELSGADLHHARLQDADLQGAVLQHAILRNSDLQGADLQHAILGDSDLQGAILQHAILHDVDFRRADLRGADLQHSDLWGADLQNAILGDSDLQGADLRGADLRHSDLQRADLQHSDLRGVDLDYASWPLWCGSLKAYVDDRIAIQLLYHTLSVVQHSPYVSEEVKKALLSEENVRIANRFHRIGECGEIKEWEEGTK